MRSVIAVCINARELIANNVIKFILIGYCSLVATNYLHIPIREIITKKVYGILMDYATAYKIRYLCFGIKNLD